MTLAAIQCKATLGATLQNTIDGVLTASVQQLLSFAVTLASGTTSNKADLVWRDITRTLSGATSETIDLYDLGSLNIGAGAGKDGLGTAWAAAEIVGLMIVNSTDSTGNVTLGGEGTGAAWNSLFNASDSSTLGPFPPGACAFFINPADPAWAVADSTNHLLKIASSDDVTYSILLLARSA